jgi:hypothetical protein
MKTATLAGVGRDEQRKPVACPKRIATGEEAE